MSNRQYDGKGRWCEPGIQTDETDYMMALAGAKENMPCPKNPDRTRARGSGIRDERSSTGKIILEYDLCTECEREKREHEDYERWKRMGMPENLLRCDLENFEIHEDWQAQAVSVCKRFVEVATGFLILVGPTGTGKDHLSAGIAKLSGRFWYATQAQLLRRLRETYRGAGSTDEYIDALCRIPMLVLSEVGVSSGGADETTLLYEVFSRRYETGNPVVLNSNLAIDLKRKTEDELSEVLGERIMSRVKGALFSIVRCTGQDYRVKLRKQYFSNQTKGTK